MNENQRRENFRIWAQTTVQNLVTIDGYIRSLDEDFPNKLNIDTVFSITDIKILKEYYDRCSQNNDLYEWSHSIGNGRPKSAILKYIQFLERNQINLNDIHAYIENNKNNFDLLKYIKLSSCNQNYFQTSLIDDDRSYSLSKIHFEIKITNNPNEYRFEIHFEEYDTTRYKLNEELNKLVNENNFEFFTWWTGRTRLNNPNNQSIKYKKYCKIENNKDLEDFIEFLEKTYKQFNNILLALSKNTNITSKGNVFLKTKNIILFGAPGVGKTHNSSKLISLIESNNKTDKEIFENIENNTDETVILNNDIKSRVKFITFHQSYSYEDFIEGFRPNENGNIELRDGIFKKLCDDASKSDKNFYIVIDEINRGNISKIFGELITLIEEDKRDKYEVTLPYSKEPFKVPSNLYIIATMNSTDKSIATIDIALRRRFTFLKMKPNLELVTNPDAKELMKKLNNFIEENLGEDYMLGHSYFMGEDIDLEFIKEYKIKPLLEEYFYADDDKLKEISDLLKSVDD